MSKEDTTPNEFQPANPSILAIRLLSKQKWKWVSSKLREQYMP